MKYLTGKSFQLLLILLLFQQIQYSYSQTKDIYSTKVIDEATLINQALQKEIDSLEAIGDYSGAVKAQLMLINLKDSIARQEKIEAVKNLQSELNAKEKENELAIANALQQSQLSQMESQKLQQYIYVGIGFVLVIIVLGLLSRLAFMRRTQKELKDKGMKIAVEKMKAEDSEKVREQFLAKMSHEIRTPMNAIMGMSNILRKQKHYPSQEKYLSAIRQSSENLLVILNDIVDLSRLKSGKIEIEKIPFKPIDEMMKLRDILKYKAEEKGLKLHCELDPKIPEVLHGDPVRLNQILINLTGNAIKFSEEGKVNVKINLKKTDNSTAILEGKIIDTGIGIPSNRLTKIFESFTQAENNTTRKYGGTGLGLTISKELVQLQNGSIYVESKPGEGSTFTFEIPYSVGKPNDINIKNSEVETIPLKELKILLVENNDFNIIVAKDELNEIIENPVIALADNGLTAVEKVKKNNFDVVLMDIEMEKMNGYEAASAIRKLDSPVCNVPIIAITANAMPNEVKMCFDAGMDEHLSKPFEARDLKLKIQKLLFKSPR